MNFSQFVLILWARKWIVAVTLGLVVAGTIAVSLYLPKSYSASTSLVINAKGTDPVTGISLPAALMPGYMATQVDIINSRGVSLKVIDKLGLLNNASVKEQFIDATGGKGELKAWLVELIGNRLQVKPSRESNVVTIIYEGSDPQFAATMANAFAEAYIDTTLQLKVEPARRAAAWFEEQVKGYRENLEKAQARLSDYQREHGIVAADERLDVETARLNEISSQFVSAQAETFDTQSRQRQMNQAGASESPDVFTNTLVQNLKMQLAIAEAKLVDLSKRVAQNHPQHQAAQGEVDHLRKRLQEEVARAGGGISETASISQRRESELRAAMASQKKRVLALKEQHDVIAALQRDVQSAQSIYENAMQRFSQTSMEGQAEQTDIAVLNEALPPTRHSSPRTKLNAVIASFIGLLLGVGLALLVEMANRRIRSVEDIAQALDLPVIGVLALPRKPFLERARLSLPGIFFWRKTAAHAG
jgi:chain length determinant protein EpsF